MAPPRRLSGPKSAWFFHIVIVRFDQAGFVARSHCLFPHLVASCRSCSDTRSLLLFRFLFLSRSHCAPVPAELAPDPASRSCVPQAFPFPKPVPNLVPEVSSLFQVDSFPAYRSGCL